MAGSNVTLHSVAITMADDDRGNTWISVCYLLGTASFTIGIPLDNAEGYLSDFLSNFKQVIAEAQKHQNNKGKIRLEVPSIEQLERMGEAGHTCKTPEYESGCLGCAVIKASQVTD